MENRPTEVLTDELKLELFGGIFSGDEQEKDYYRARFERVARGEPTFIVRNPDSNNNVVLDYFSASRHAGFIAFSDGLCDVFMTFERDKVEDYWTNPATSISSDPMPLSGAVDLIRHNFSSRIESEQLKVRAFRIADIIAKRKKANRRGLSINGI